MSPRLPKLVFVAFLVVQCILWSQSRYTQFGGPHRFAVSERPGLAGLVRRNLLSPPTEDECSPLDFPVEDQCAHVLRDICPDPDTFLSIPYLHSYFCTAPHLRPLAFSALLLWLVFLFSTLGISASDFFCPNLATIAQVLGLDENVAGVTFLAYGNGSPDVFSTFSAMRADSGSLAVGELLGAASFIVSCVVGSMCIIKPFRVDPAPFLRDVGFFTAAVTLLLGILWDGLITISEASALVALYVVYVGVVVFGSWWERRQENLRRTQALIRSEYGEDDEDDLTPHEMYHDEEPYTDEPEEHSHFPVPFPTSTRERARALSTPMPIPSRLSSSATFSRRPVSQSISASASNLAASTPHLHTHHPHATHSHPRLTHLPSFSLVGALEFRDVVASLRNQSSSAALSVFERTPLPLLTGHSYRHPHPLSSVRTPTTRDREVDPWDAALGSRHSRDELRLAERSPPSASGSTAHLGDGGGGELSVPAESTLVASVSSIGSISRTPVSPILESPSDAPSVPFPLQATGNKRRERIMRVLGQTSRVLFPTLHNFRSKSIAGAVAAIFAAPAVLALTLTLPVVETPYSYGGITQEKGLDGGGPVVEYDDRTVTGEAGVQEGRLVQEDLTQPEEDFNKWLVAAQCVLGPLWCVGVLFSQSAQRGWLFTATAIAGLATAALVVVFADRGNDLNAKMARCSMGFIVAIVWIMAIADEVVNVLQTFGFMFGLSDAIVGLTIFAAGNSLADLVANMSVAVFAPIMGFSACFGSPMLNILLGVGLSGLYVIHKTGEGYTLKFSQTLLASSIGLLVLLIVTLVFVPLNGYFLSRRWGVFLIVAYFVMMAANVAVEIRR